MKIFTLAQITPDYFKPRGYDYDFTLNKYQAVVVRDALAQELINDNFAKVSEGEINAAGQLYQPITNPYNPLGDFDADPDAAQEFPLPPLDPVTGK
jgi:hypothetical protein